MTNCELAPNTPKVENPFRRRNVSIPVGLYAKLATQAKNKNRTISEYVRQLIQTGLDKEEAAAALTEARNKR